MKDYAATAGATATINVATINFAAPAPLIAPFSSRGPSRAANGDILKPDVSAPGVDVLAAWLLRRMCGPQLRPLERNVDVLAACRGRGRAAQGPSSRLVADGDQVGADDYGVRPPRGANAFTQGAGHINMPKAGDPGLVYDSGPANWISFICGTGQLTGSLCTAFGTIDPSDLNQASIAIGDLAGSQTVTRTVKNVGATAETYTPAVTNLLGSATASTRLSFTIAPGASQTYTATFTHDGDVGCLHAGLPGLDRERRPCRPKPGGDPTGRACRAA